MQDYRNDIDRLNTYAKIPDRAMINIIVNKLTGPLLRSMAHYEHLRENPDEWRKKCKEVTYRVYSFVTTSQGYPDILSCDLNKHVSWLSDHVIIESHGIL